MTGHQVKTFSHESDRSQAYLVLQDGDVFSGVSFGAIGPHANIEAHPESCVGEVVFNTSHSGFEEIASDPSYLNQIVVMTQPHQGNYGSDQSVWESRKFWIKGFICLQIQNSRSNSSWLQMLRSQGVPVLSEVDTRRLVLKLRNQGTPWGAIVTAPDEASARNKGLSLIAAKKEVDSDWVHLASRSEVEVRVGKNPRGPRIAVLDFGSKENILRELQMRCSELKIFPSRTKASEIAAWAPDSLMLTNGPGDPALVQVAPQTVKEFIGRIPVFGICMGHQVLALAMGAKTYKLKFGHRGANHPIQDRLLNQVYMSSQNHGYAVDASTLPESVQVTHVNLNDQSVAGFFSEKLKCLGIQYHPEACPGPHEAQRLFDFYFSMIQKNEAKKNDRPLTV